MRNSPSFERAAPFNYLLFIIVFTITVKSIRGRKKLLLVPGRYVNFPPQPGKGSSALIFNKFFFLEARTVGKGREAGEFGCGFLPCVSLVNRKKD